MAESVTHVNQEAPMQEQNTQTQRKEITRQFFVVINFINLLKVFVSLFIGGIVGVVVFQLVQRLLGLGGEQMLMSFFAMLQNGAASDAIAGGAGTGAGGVVAVMTIRSVGGLQGRWNPDPDDDRP